MNRRELMKSAVTAAMAPLVVPASALGRQGSVPPSDRITVGAIGVGNRARLDLSQLLPQKDARVVAICDVNSNARDAALTLVNKQYGDKGCREYRDFRELLAQKDIDAVMIASPDHWHVPMMTAAAKAGKDIFAEKPMGLAIAWTQAAREAVLRSGVVFQWGAHQHTHRMYEHAMRVVHSGKIGELKVVRAWVPSSEWSGDRPAALPKVVPVPDYLDWDMWQGPAPATTYWEGKERGWYGRSDYSRGSICNWGVHNLDICLWGMAPLAARTMEVSGSASFPREGVSDNATGWDVTFRFDHGVPIHYVSLGRRPEEWRRRYKWLSDHGVAFEGTEGWVQVHRLGISAEPASLLDDMDVPPDYRENEAIYALFRNFLDCVRNRNRPAAHIEHAAQVDMTCIIADMAVRLGKPLAWDIRQERFLNNETANRLRTRAMRSPWQA